MWTAFIAVLFGLGPTLLIGVTVMAIAQMSWLITTAHLGLPLIGVLPTLVVVPLVAVFYGGERAWKAARKSDQAQTLTSAYWITSLFALGLSLVLAFVWVPQVGSHRWMQPQGVGSLSSEGTWASWMQHLGIEWPSSQSAANTPTLTPTTVTGEVKFAVVPQAADGHAAEMPSETSITATLSPPAQNVAWHFSARLFDVPAIWLVVGLMVSILRIVIASTMPRANAANILPSVDRVLLRLMSLGVVLVAGGLLWEVGVAITRGGHLGKASIGAAGSGGLFALLRNWLAQLQSNEQRPSKLEALKPYLPQVLAYVTVGLMYALVVAAALIGLNVCAESWQAAWLGCWVVIALALHMDPSEFGLHKLYRDRISRAFMGASNPKAYDETTGSFSKPNRFTDVRVGDDPMLTELAEAKGPLHLVCCAANHLSGDQLSTLSRGARSAVLSCCGLSIGNRWAKRPDISLADAVTASAAAFNSQMGALSIKLGSAVGFLMSVLNLRLGIWVSSPNSANAEPRWFPGLMFLAEMFGFSDSSDESKSHVHLSDGGHFENLALYELIRRHCRYIIVSDCGADPSTTFEDFGNAVRRIREDFGVEIDIDLDPLRAGPDGKSKQHLAVGTIRFDPHGDDFDIGVLMYFKPALDGDEPCDISNYRALNPAFPHESTGDQFYDEAQWESYRRLGVHSVMDALSFMEGHDHGRAGGGSPADVKLKLIHTVFGQARDKWYPTPLDFKDTLISLNGRFVGLEQRVAEKAPMWFVAELFPELEPIAKRQRAAAPENGAAEPAAVKPGNRLAEEREVVHLLVQMIQLLEDAWLETHLDRNFNHPQMLGWVNAFRRWTHTETFRIWWPYLCPLFTPGMRAFAVARFDLAPTEQLFAIEIANVTTPDDRDLMEVAKRASQTVGWAATNQTFKFVVFSIVAKGLKSDDDQQIKLPLAALRYFEKPGAAATVEVCWDDDDFIIAHGMWGTGLGSKSMSQWLGGGEMAGRTCVVELDLYDSANTSFHKNDVGHRRERNDLLNFYKRQGFVQSQKDGTKLRLVRRP